MTRTASKHPDPARANWSYPDCCPTYNYGHMKRRFFFPKIFRWRLYGPRPAGVGVFLMVVCVSLLASLVFIPRLTKAASYEDGVCTVVAGSVIPVDLQTDFSQVKLTVTPPAEYDGVLSNGTVDVLYPREPQVSVTDDLRRYHAVALHSQSTGLIDCQYSNSESEVVLVHDVDVKQAWLIMILVPWALNHWMIFFSAFNFQKEVAMFVSKGDKPTGFYRSEPSKKRGVYNFPFHHRKFGVPSVNMAFRPMIVDAALGPGVREEVVSLMEKHLKAMRMSRISTFMNVLVFFVSCPLYLLGIPAASAMVHNSLAVDLGNMTNAVNKLLVKRGSPAYIVTGTKRSDFPDSTDSITSADNYWVEVWIPEHIMRTAETPEGKADLRAGTFELPSPPDADDWSDENGYTSTISPPTIAQVREEDSLPPPPIHVPSSNPPSYSSVSTTSSANRPNPDSSARAVPSKKNSSETNIRNSHDAPPSFAAATAPSISVQGVRVTQADIGDLEAIVAIGDDGIPYVELVPIGSGAAGKAAAKIPLRVRTNSTISTGGERPPVSGAPPMSTTTPSNRGSRPVTPISIGGYGSLLGNEEEREGWRPRSRSGSVVSSPRVSRPHSPVVLSPPRSPRGRSRSPSMIPGAIDSEDDDEEFTGRPY